MTIHIKIIYKLKDNRIKSGYTTRQLAYLSGVSKSNISAIENGRITPSITILCLLAVALHVKPEELYTYEILKK